MIKKKKKKVWIFNIKKSGAFPLTGAIPDEISSGAPGLAQDQNLKRSAFFFGLFWKDQKKDAFLKPLGRWFLKASLFHSLKSI